MPKPEPTQWSIYGTSSSESFKLVQPADDGRLAGVSRQESPTKETCKRESGISHQTTSECQPDERLVGPVNTTKVVVSGSNCQALLDTGLQVTTIADDFIMTHLELWRQTLKETDIKGVGGQNVLHRGVYPPQY